MAEILSLVHTLVKIAAPLGHEDSGAGEVALSPTVCSVAGGHHGLKSVLGTGIDD